MILTTLQCKQFRTKWSLCLARLAKHKKFLKVAEHSFFVHSGQWYSLKVGTDFEKRNKYGEYGETFWKCGTSEVKILQRNPAKFCAWALAQEFVTNGCWLFYWISCQPFVRFCRNLKLISTANELSIKTIRNWTDKNLGKLKNVPHRIMKNLCVEILWKELLNILCYMYLTIIRRRWSDYQWIFTKTKSRWIFTDNHWALF